MICKPCRDQNHGGCPSMPRPYDSDKPTVVHPTGLSDEGNKIQASGLCPCQHKVPLAKPITLEEAEAKIRAGLTQWCKCGARISTGGPTEPEGEAGEFVRLWFEDHSYEDLSRHGKLVTAKTKAMRAAAK